MTLKGTHENVINRINLVFNKKIRLKCEKMKTTAKPDRFVANIWNPPQSNSLNSVKEQLLRFIYTWEMIFLKLQCKNLI
jgi:hypothetical protein